MSNLQSAEADSSDWEDVEEDGMEIDGAQGEGEHVQIDPEEDDNDYVDADDLDGNDENMPVWFCHSCEDEIEPVLPEHLCPQCNGGFIEDISSM